MAFGLDIGTSLIKAVQLEKDGSKFTLVAAGIAQAPPKGIDSEVENDLVGVAEVIKKLVSDTKITTKDVCISLPESKVFTRIVKFPLLTDEEVASAISWQAEPNIPIPVADSSLDYQIVQRRQPQGTDPGGVDVLLVAAPKTLIQKYSKVLNMAGLNVISAETELLALARSLAPEKQTALIVDMGGTSTDLAIVQSGQLVISRSVATGGEVLTRALSTGLSVSTSQAEEYKKAYGLSSTQLEGKVRAALEPAFRIIVDEMKKTVQYYKTEFSGSGEVSVAILSGGTSTMPDVTVILAKSLGIEVVNGDPWTHVIKDERTTRSIAPFASLYSVAIGLAQNF